MRRSTKDIIITLKRRVLINRSRNRVEKRKDCVSVFILFLWTGAAMFVRFDSPLNMNQAGNTHVDVPVTTGRSRRERRERSKRANLTFSLPRCHLKTTNGAKFEIHKLFFIFFIF